MKKVYLIIAVALMTTVSALAETRNREEAQTIAIEHARKLGINVQATSLRRCAVSKVSTEKTPYYVFNNGSNKGWTIVSGDDRLSPILGYSTEGDFDWDEMPAPVQEMLNGVSKCVSQLDDATADATARLAQRRASSTATKPIGPLMTTKWDQYQPYYNKTPLSGGSHCATCCVVTAFAQILYYLYYTQGAQDSTTIDSDIPAYTLASNYTSSYVAGEAVTGPRTYRWADMLPDYAGANYTDAQADAIATLMRDCGTACEAKYGVSASVTNSNYVSSKAVQYFGLSTSSLGYQSSVRTASAWHTAVDNELSAYRPVQVAGNGHAFVCDGRDADDMYHFNFGYSGRGNGFYSFDALLEYDQDMRITTGLRLDGAKASYTSKQKLQIVYNSAVAVMQVEPVGTVPGQYRAELYDALQAKLDEAKAALNGGYISMTDAQILALAQEVSAAEQNMTEHRVPYLTGTYYIKTYHQYASGTKGMYANGSNLRWGNLSTSATNYYKWYIEYDPFTNAYIMQNMGSKTYFSNIGKYGNGTLSADETARVEIWPTNQIAGTTDYDVSIRPIFEGYRNDNCRYCYQDANNSGSGISGAVVGWEPYADYAMWVLEAIDVLPTPESTFAEDTLSLQIGESRTNTLTSASNGAVTYTSSDPSVATVDENGQVTAVEAGTATISVVIAKTDEYSIQRLRYTVSVAEDPSIRQSLDSLVASAEGMYTDVELQEAKSASTDVVSKGLITKSSQFSSPYTETTEGSFDYLLDNNASTFWHSKWSAGSVKAGTHYFIVTLNDAVTSELLLSMTRRSGAESDHVTQFNVTSSTDGTNYGDATTLDFTYTTDGETVTANFTPCADCKYLKFLCTATNSNRGYFHMGEFQLYTIQHATPTDIQLALIQLGDAVESAKTVSPATKADLTALQQAVDAYQQAVAVGIHSTSVSTSRDGKYLRNGQLVIRRSGHEYSVTGMRLK